MELQGSFSSIAIERLRAFCECSYDCSVSVRFEDFKHYNKLKVVKSNPSMLFDQV